MFMEDVIDEFEFSMLFETVNKKNPSFPYWLYDRFDLTRVTDEECKAEFRFGLAELQTFWPFLMHLFVETGLWQLAWKDCASFYED